MHRRWLIVWLFVTVAAPVQAQRVALEFVIVADTSVRHVVKLRDGSTLVGRITAVSADSVRLRLTQGEVTLAKTGIAEVRQVPQTALRNGEYWFENPHSTRLLFSSTAFPLERGTGYYANAWLFVHTFAVGLTDRFTLGGGATTVPGFAIHENPFFLLPKYTVFAGARTQVALGALIGFLPLDATSTAGLLYAVGTTGTRESNVSLGLGWGYANDEVLGNRAVMLGGQGRVSRRVSLISENWFFSDGSETEGVISYGLRFLGENLSVDLAWVTALGGRGIGIPWLGFAFKF